MCTPRKGEDKWYLTSYERDVIQPHTLGKFKDLADRHGKKPRDAFLSGQFSERRSPRRATPGRPARHAARIAAASAGRFRHARLPQKQQAKKNTRGLNENYGRELMELHTLGVEGGYTQKDVTELARCFTGWTIEKPRAESAIQI